MGSAITHINSASYNSTGDNHLQKSRRCIVCGNEIAGRSDKKYCSAECKSFYNNIKTKNKTQLIKENKEIRGLRSNVLVLYNKKASNSLKFLLLMSKFLRIITTFRKN